MEPREGPITRIPTEIQQLIIEQASGLNLTGDMLAS